jgi:hypothetical protein
MIDRHNEDLNVLLAQLYEMEQDYEKAEILFRDIILHHDPKKQTPTSISVIISSIRARILSRMIYLKKVSKKILEMSSSSRLSESSRMSSMNMRNLSSILVASQNLSQKISAALRFWGFLISRSVLIKKRTIHFSLFAS